MTSDFDKRIDHSADEWGRKPWRTTAKWLIGGAGLVILVVAMIGLISTGSVFFEAGAAKVTAPAKVTREIYQPNNIISQVAFFTTTCEDVGRDYQNWSSNKASYERAKSLAASARTQGEAAEARDETSQLSTYMSGALTNLHNDAAAYNARSINYTANKFRSVGLPEKITVPTTETELATWQPPVCG